MDRLFANIEHIEFRWVKRVVSRREPNDDGTLPDSEVSICMWTEHVLQYRVHQIGQWSAWTDVPEGVE